MGASSHPNVMVVSPVFTESTTFSTRRICFVPHHQPVLARNEAISRAEVFVFGTAVFSDFHYRRS